ncbi:MAG TPA: cytochrome c3 family protein, partial [Candidatus Deferrimicrobium sp.]|nr:cytochrome c3 family protein [Candidatus Deferrimicrobium sp.]
MTNLSPAVMSEIPERRSLLAVASGGELFSRSGHPHSERHAALCGGRARRLIVGFRETTQRFLFILFILVSLAGAATAQTVEDCLTCHEDQTLTTGRRGVEISLFIDEKLYRKSVHGEQSCVDCHADLTDSDFPHSDTVAPVDCGTCHDDVVKLYGRSLHGQAVTAGERLAPRCPDCHGAHDIVGPKEPESRVNKFNIPFMCGRCHKEGTEVTRTYDIPQDSILSHYSVSIHGEGLYKKGLTVSAVCTDCHTAHSVLPHTDPASSIHRDNVPKTCQNCHGRIEQVHRQVIKGELWEKEPGKVPICVDCHPPHEIRRVFYDEGLSDEECLACHDRPTLTTVRDGDTVSLVVDTLQILNSIHRKTTCAQCHTGALRGPVRPCATVAERVDCSICHPEVAVMYATSTHGILANRGDPDAPLCIDCHGTHAIKPRRDPKSPTFPSRVPELCGLCHREGSKAAMRYTSTQRNILSNYTESIHGKGLLE